jgi:biopolymer transport protein TolR
VTAAGNLYLEKRAVSRDELLGLLRRATPRAAQQAGAEGRQAVTYGLMRALFRECQGLGFPGVSLQVGDKGGGRELTWRWTSPPAAGQRTRSGRR